MTTTNKPIISFDLWGTLIKGDPTFKDKKYEFFKMLGLTLNKDEFNSIFSQVDVQIDTLVETYGIQPHIDTVFAILLNRLGICHVSISDVISKYLQYFFYESNLFYLDDVEEVITTLSDKYDLLLASNTVFIPGSLLMQKLPHIKNNFKYLLFSDEMLISKPLNLWSGWESDIVCHVGDNLVTDGSSEKYNIPFIHVKNDIKEKLKHLL